MTKIIFVQGDITRQDVEAIINAANPSLTLGSGVTGAIHRAPVLCRCVHRGRFLSGGHFFHKQVRYRGNGALIVDTPATAGGGQTLRFPDWE